MNKPATLTPKAPLLMLVAALALSTSFYAGATPAFLDYAQQQTQAHEKAILQPQSKRQAIVKMRIIKKTPNTAQLQKESPANRQRLRKKIKLSNN